MATIAKISEYGRDPNGRWIPGYLTHAELVAELLVATGERRVALVAEAERRMRQPDYPPFPASSGIRPTDHS